MTKVTRGKNHRRVRGCGGLAGIVATAKFTTAEYKQIFIEQEQARLERAEAYRQRQIHRRGYA